MEETLLNIEVAYAQPASQQIVALNVPTGTSVQQAITLSGLLTQYLDIDLARNNKVGIFSLPCSLDQILQAGDRVEIYRALQQDPKEARRNRASKR